ncbi:MAG: diaminopimelate decarboxylase, partial [Gammaproteobacteria bacterium]|nr:diaminopimelate decarboxylase [Gammaproteobacteria bacterium]
AQAAAMTHLDIHGIDCHIGSQLTETAPFIEALQKVLSLADQLNTQGIHISHLDMGGGLGIRYADEQPPLPGDLATALRKTLAGNRYKLLVEPGRAIVGNAGILLTQVEYLKCSDHKNFAIVDAAMNDLLRPSLYSAWQEIIPVTPNMAQPRRVYDVVGPVCETGDFLGKERALAIKAGDLLAVRSAGAYGFSMSSNYNTRPRAAEVMVDGEQHTLVREREKVADLFLGERILDD